MHNEKIKAFAIKQGFQDIKPLGKYNDSDIYQPIFTDGKKHIVGFPQYIMVKDENISLEELQNKMPELFEQAHQQYNNSLIKLFNDVSYYNAVKDACLESF